MKPLVLACLFLVLAAAGGSGVAKAQTPAPPRVEVLFVLDSTGSMSGTIAEAKERILEIAASIASGEPRPDVRFGVVTYRDRGDAYVTKRWPLTRDWDETRRALETIRADGGGDTPESVVQALHEGIRDTAWTLDAQVMKLLYLIGDAHPKQYDDDPDIDLDLAWAVQNGVVVQSIGCAGLSAEGAAFFRRAAQGTEGRYHPLEARAAAVLPGEVVEVEAVREAPPRLHEMSRIVARTARTYSSEIGVDYEAPVVATVSAAPVAGDGPLFAASGLYGRHVRVVRDARTWRLLWAAHGSTSAVVSPLPAVDFSAEAVVVVSLARGGLTGVDLGLDDGTLVVRPHRTDSGPRVAMLRVASFDGAARLHEEKGGER